MPYWDDLDMDPGRVLNGGIFTETTGTAPNRTWKIEWRARPSSSQQTGPPNIDFAVYFHENSDDFDYIYSQSGTGNDIFGWNSTVGVQGKSWGTNFTEYSVNMQWIYDTMKLHASRPAVVCSGGAGTCAQIASRTPFDFDGDRKADISVFRPSEGNWYIQNSPDGASFGPHFGRSTI